MAYGGDHRVLSDEEQKEYNEEIANNILHDAGVETHKRLSSLSVRDINRILQVAKNYKNLDRTDQRESEDNSETFSLQNMHGQELEKMIFNFIAEAQDANRDVSDLNKKLKKLSKLSTEKKLSEEKISIIKEKLDETFEGGRESRNLKRDLSSIKRIKVTVLENAVKEIINPRLTKETTENQEYTNRFMSDQELEKIKFDESKRPKSRTKGELEPKIHNSQQSWDNIEGSTKQSQRKMILSQSKDKYARRPQKRPWGNQKPNLDKRF